MAETVIDWKQTEVWLSQGEDMVFVAAQLPAELGRWYHDGIQQFGAATVVRLLQDNALQNEPEFPYLARIKLHTVQNYASIYRAILADPRLAGYDVWHVEAVLGVQEGERMVLLNAGRAEQMSVGRFRRYRDEMLGKLPRDNSSEFHDRAQLDELRVANRDVKAAVEGYAVDLAIANQTIADLKAQLVLDDQPTSRHYPLVQEALARASVLSDDDPQRNQLLLQAELDLEMAEQAEGVYASASVKAHLRYAHICLAHLRGEIEDEHPADVAYRQSAAVEWYDGMPACPRCGGQLVCERCGEWEI